MLSKKTIKHYLGFMSLVLVFVLILSTEARAVMFGFECITNTNNDDADIGESQLSVDVTDPGSSQVLFTFNNIGSEACTITDIYLMDGKLKIASINNVSGISFSKDANPAHLPSFNIPFDTFFTADSDVPGLMANGISQGEWLGLLFDIDSGYSYNEVITDIANSNMIIGLHVQGFDSGGSESFITPIPPSVVLGILGMSVVGLKLRKFA